MESEPKKPPNVEKFDLIPTSSKSYLFFITLFVVFYVIFFLIYGVYILEIFLLLVVFSALSIFLTPIIWNKMGKRVLNQLIFKNFEIMRNGNALIKFSRKCMNMLLGFKLKNVQDYYLQNTVPNFNANNIKQVLKKNIFDVLSATFALTFFIATILRYLNIEYFTIMWTIFILLPITPLFLFWLIPVIWTSSDGQIKKLEQDKSITNLGAIISGSIFKKFLGVAGIILAVNFLLDLSRFELLEPDVLVEMEGGELVHATEFSETEFSLLVFVSMIEYLVLFSLIIMALSVLICLRYLNKFHEKNVNQLRQQMVHIDIPVKSLQLDTLKSL